MYALISQLTLVCNMQLNVLDDLAEAMKALDGKKRVLCCAGHEALRHHILPEVGPRWLTIFPSNAFMASARSSNTFNCMLQNSTHTHGRLQIEGPQE